MLSEDSGERRQLRTQSVLGGAQQQPEAEQLPCPRCDSTNTKFCYYNNYNLSQPRHFCKACRRYWTRGGTLRNVPVGGGSRKNSKRSRAASSTTAAAAAASTASVHDPAPGTPTSASLPLKPTEMGMVPMDPSDMNLSGNAGSFTSLLSSQASSGFLALGGFGLGVGPGFEEMGLGSGRAGGFWPYQEVGDAVTIGSHGVGGGVATGASPGGCNPWQFSGSDSGYVDGDCFAWPDLAISMSGKGLK